MQIADNKRIARNTLFLYFRMILVMGVMLYTSRVILATLGEVDFGIYTIIGGIVILMSFMKSSMTTAVQRYMNYALGKGDRQYEQDIYSSSFRILGILMLITFFLLETGGLWFINNKLTIPSDKIWDANVVYQLSIACFVVNIFRVPLDALIMAHECMSFYAYVSILEVFLKFIIAISLLLVPVNKLVLYAFLVLIVTIIINVICHIYCYHKFSLAVFGRKNSQAIKDLTSFSGWNVLEAFSNIGYQQGTNIILNIFFGVSYNATTGISVQVKNATFNFIRNILVASNPQIFQTYSAGDYGACSNLILRISRLNYLLILLISIPLLFNMQYILELWLGELPPMCYEFCMLTVVFCLFDSLIGPLWTAAQAEGKIKKYQIITSSILLLNLPLTYFSYRMGAKPYSLLIVQIIIVIVSLVYRISHLVSIRLLLWKNYIFRVLLPISIVTTNSVIACWGVNCLFPNEGLDRIWLNTPFYIITTIIIICFIGLTRAERKTIFNYIIRLIK